MRPPSWMPRPGPGLPREVLPGDVGALTYRTLLRDGVTRVVWGELAVAADVPLDPPVRAAAFRALVPARAVVGRRSAVWVHTGQHAPRRVDVLVAPRTRRPDPHPRRSTHECVLPASDVLDLDGVRVTDVQRTGLDVARWLPADEARVLLDALLTVGFDAARARTQLEALPGYAGTLGAAQLLASLPGVRRGSPAPPRPSPR